MYIFIALPRLPSSLASVSAFLFRPTGNGPYSSLYMQISNASGVYNKHHSILPKLTPEDFFMFKKSIKEISYKTLIIFKNQLKMVHILHYIKNKQCFRGI